MKVKPYTDSQLRRWRRLSLVRDSRTFGNHGERFAICAICGINVAYPSYQIQMHHIRPKSLYPVFALRLDNSVGLCTGHHQGIVHNNNSFMDIKNKEYDSGWRNFLPLFVRWNELKYNREFNEINQERIM